MIDAIKTLKRILCKALGQVEDMLDVSQDLIDTAKISSDQLKQEATIEAEQQLKALSEASSKTNSTTKPKSKTKAKPQF